MKERNATQRNAKAIQHADRLKILIFILIFLNTAETPIETLLFLDSF